MPADLQSIAQIIEDKTICDLNLQNKKLDKHIHFLASEQHSYPRSLSPVVTKDIIDTLIRLKIHTLFGQPLIEILIRQRAVALIEYYYANSQIEIPLNRSPLYILTCSTSEEEALCREIILILKSYSLNTNLSISRFRIPSPHTQSYVSWLHKKKLLNWGFEISLGKLVQTVTRGIVFFASYKSGRVLFESNQRSKSTQTRRIEWLWLPTSLGLLSYDAFTRKLYCPLFMPKSIVFSKIKQDINHFSLYGFLSGIINELIINC